MTAIARGDRVTAYQGGFTGQVIAVSARDQIAYAVGDDLETFLTIPIPLLDKIGGDQ